MKSLLAMARHELNMAWRRWQIRRSITITGLADSGWLLHGLVRSMKPEVCVEIGSAHGHSTCLIALALHQNIKGRLWAVDPHEINPWSDDTVGNTYEILQRNLKRVRVAHRVEIIRKRTVDAIDDLPRKIDFAFIDGDHSYEGVSQDWAMIQPRMSEFGVAVFHDTLWDYHASEPIYVQWRRENMGVPRLLEELRLQGFPIITVDRDWGLSLVQTTRGGVSIRSRSCN